jgi:hypothetical protein
VLDCRWDFGAVSAGVLGRSEQESRVAARARREGIGERGRGDGGEEKSSCGRDGLRRFRSLAGAASLKIPLLKFEKKNPVLRCDFLLTKL